MRTIATILLTLLILNCKAQKLRWSYAYINVFAKVDTILSKKNDKDTLLVYYNSCSGCIKGIEKNAYVFELKDGHTFLTRISNYTEFKKIEVYFPWTYLIGALKELKTEAFIDSAKFDHGPYQEITIQIGAEKINYSFHLYPTKHLNEGKTRVILIDKIKSILSDQHFIETNRKFKPKGYNPKKRKWQEWDNENENEK